MKLTRSVAYAIGVLLRVNGTAGVGPVTAARIADGCKLPPRFLYRILRKLVDQGLLRATSGPKGGYRLARNAEEINVLQIVQAIEGPLKPTKLVPIHHQLRAATAQVNVICEQNAKDFAAALKEVSLASMQPPPKKKRAASEAAEEETAAPAK